MAEDSPNRIVWNDGEVEEGVQQERGSHIDGRGHVRGRHRDGSNRSRIFRGMSFSGSRLR